MLQRGKPAPHAVKPSKLIQFGTAVGLLSRFEARWPCQVAPIILTSHLHDVLHQALQLESQIKLLFANGLE